METDVLNGKKKRFKRKLKEDLSAYLLLLIPIILFITFTIVPFVKSIFFSFTDWGLSGQWGMVGFKNYIDIFKDEMVLKGFMNTFVWTFVLLVGVNVTAVLIALGIKALGSGKWQKIMLGFLFWPCLVSIVVSAEIQKQIFSPSASGLMNILLGFFHIAPLKWIASSNMLSLISIMIMPFFLGFGMKMIVYYVGLKNIPSSFYEAASLETNERFLIFKNITLPLLRPIILLNVILSLMEGFKVIAPMQIINNGGVNNSSMSVVLAIYNYAFVPPFALGYSCAIAVVLFVLILVITIIKFKTTKEADNYE